MGVSTSWSSVTSGSGPTYLPAVTSAGVGASAAICPAGVEKACATNASGVSDR